MQQFIIEKNEAGQRLDKFLCKYLKEAQAGFLHKMLRKKNITLNDRKAEGKEKLKEGDCIRFYFSQETFLKFRGKVSPDYSEKERQQGQGAAEYQKAFVCLKGIKVIYEDPHILLVNKPAGILSQKAENKDISLNEWMIGYLLNKGEITVKQLETFKPSVCNRLDRNTSGLVICGKSLAGSRKMNELLRERSIHKYYRTFVKGRLTEEACIRAYLIKDKSTNQVRIAEVKEEGGDKPGLIETRYLPLSCYGGITYLEVELITGKPHQIRAHLAYLGHPILGDYKYGDSGFNHSFSSHPPKWQLLHAYRLEMPILEGAFEQLSQKIFTAPEPEYFEQIKREAIG